MRLLNPSPFCQVAIQPPTRISGAALGAALGAASKVLMAFRKPCVGVVLVIGRGLVFLFYTGEPGVAIRGE